jgi:DNA-binding response OmpR family regulator
MPILIIEDEKKLVSILKVALKSELYTVDVAFDGEEGLAKALKNHYSMIILDIMLPKKDGFTVCRELRRQHIHTPIIMLTARDTLEDRIIGLDAGADDYLIKPFGMKELFARIRAVLRRRKITEGDVIKFMNLIMDRKKHEVTRGGKVIDLTPKEYKILEVFLLNQEEAISRQKLIAHAWGPDFKETNNELNVHIKYLRTKINKDSKEPLIHTIRGVGFVLKK